MTDLHITANDNGKLIAFIGETVKSYQSVAISLHQSAAMALYHACQFRDDCAALNALHNGLRINDQTALKRWISTLTLAPANTEANPGNEPATLVGFKKDKGFFVRKGLKSVDVFTLDDLLAVDPFYSVNVAKASAIDLFKLLEALAKVAKATDKRATDNDIALPDNIRNLLKDISKVTDEAKLAAANDDERAAARSNVANG